MRALVCVCWVIAVFTSALTACWAEGSDQIRFYLGLRDQEWSRRSPKFACVTPCSTAV
jgi:hypothetical protein